MSSLVKETFMKRYAILNLISTLFILLFAYTGVSKFINLDSFEKGMVEANLLRQFAPFLSIAVPVIEILTAFLLISDRYKKVGLISSFVMMFLFTLYVYYILFFAKKIPCSCGGIISKMSWTQHLVFNIVFTILALSGILLNRLKLKETKQQNDIVYA